MMTPSALLARVRAKKPPATTLSPAKRRSAPLTAAALESAIAAACAGLDRTSSTRRTLERLDALTEGVAEGAPVSIDGPAPVTLAQLDGALAEVSDLDELPGNSLKTLKRVRELIAAAEARDAKAPAALFVTRAELDSAIDAFGEAIGCVAGQLGRTHCTSSDILAQLGRIASVAPERTRPFLRRLVDAVCAHREPERRPESQEDRLYRNNYGRARPQ